MMNWLSIWVGIGFGLGSTFLRAGVDVDRLNIILFFGFGCIWSLIGIVGWLAYRGLTTL